MRQVIKQIRERYKIDLELEGVKYQLWRLDDLEFAKLLKNSRPIEKPDYRFYLELFNSQRGRETELDLAKIFVTLESLFGETGDFFDKSKTRDPRQQTKNFKTRLSNFINEV
jgi:hypothetical protein